jgi:hypothetical protein
MAGVLIVLCSLTPGSDPGKRRHRMLGPQRRTWTNECELRRRSVCYPLRFQRKRVFSRCAPAGKPAGKTRASFRKRLNLFKKSTTFGSSPGHHVFFIYQNNITLSQTVSRSQSASISARTIEDSRAKSSSVWRMVSELSRRREATQFSCRKFLVAPAVLFNGYRGRFHVSSRWTAVGRSAVCNSLLALRVHRRAVLDGYRHRHRDLSIHR